MAETRWVLGIDISTQTITAMLLGVAEVSGSPSEVVISGDWIASRSYADGADRKTPAAWVGSVRECISELKKKFRETELVESIGLSTTFPGAFPVLRTRGLDPDLVSLYDNTDDGGTADPEFEELLGCAESETLNRMWPGNMAIGMAHLVRSAGLRLEDVAVVAPPNTAFAHALLNECGQRPDPAELVSDFTQTAISGLYDARTGAPAPPGVLDVLKRAVPGQDWGTLADLLPRAEPSWRNVVPKESLDAVRTLTGLPDLKAISIGAGDSALGALALSAGPDVIVNVRGSSDSPAVVVESPRGRTTLRETVLHYPLPSVTSLKDSPWCVVAPMLRSGRVWDWVRNLGFPGGGADADRELEALAVDALKKRLRSPDGSLERSPLRFVPALGGERAPDWDVRATGTLAGLIESHGVGDIALAALEGMSVSLRACLTSIEERYAVEPDRLLLVGGPTRNALWSWVTAILTDKRTFASTFSDASVLGAALIGYAASLDGELNDGAVSERLASAARLAASDPLIRPAPIGAPDSELAAMETQYRADAARIIGAASSSWTQRTPRSR